ncbi:A24 family peptidase [Pontivivens ytuae]|uniref:Prepilin peptidase n=1 Tax=Pontivivens ytuae TaxID=2789856 RepID=A0A7S9LUA1_9RHOB|nr:prepilin peptidase [Pontivivens ytuae]QPH55288.1 prepilin peptidase [Pontivivens ytuae]
MTSETATIFLMLVAIPAVIVIWQDLREMKISNKLSLVLLGLFAVSAPFLLTGEEILWRVVSSAVVFAIGLMLYMIRQMGAGDVKYATVIVLFVAPLDITLFMRILGVLALAGLLTHRMFGRIPAARAAAPDWVSWDQPTFSYGMALSGAILYYLTLVALAG